MGCFVSADPSSWRCPSLSCRLARMLLPPRATLALSTKGSQKRVDEASILCSTSPPGFRPLGNVFNCQTTASFFCIVFVTTRLLLPVTNTHHQIFHHHNQTNRNFYYCASILKLLLICGDWRTMV
ncbi:Amino-acid acetyltransferase [Trichinella pseudospiralis]